MVRNLLKVDCTVVSVVCLLEHKSIELIHIVTGLRHLVNVVFSLKLDVVLVPVEDVIEGGGGGHGDSGNRDREDWHRLGSGDKFIGVVDHVSGDVTDLLGDLPAHPDGNPLVVNLADLLGNLGALGDRLTLADLVGDLVALLPVDILTLLLGDILAHLVRHLLAVGLLDIVTLVHGVLLAAAGDDGPDLLPAGGHLPVELAVVLILGHALRLGEGLQHGLVLVPADLVVDRLADLVLNQLALLPRGVMAQPFRPHLALLLVHCLARLVSLLLDRRTSKICNILKTVF